MDIPVSFGIFIFQLNKIYLFVRLFLRNLLAYFQSMEVVLAVDVLRRFEKVIRYWNEIRCGEHLPCRTAFNPAAVRSYLSRIMIIERDEARVFHVRLAGTEVALRVGFEMTNESFRTLNQLDEKEAMEHQRLFHGILDQPMAGYGCREWLTDKGPYNCYFVSLPFLDKHGDANVFFIAGDFDKSLAEIGGSKFQQFGKLREFTTVDIGYGIDNAFDMYPKDSMVSLLSKVAA